MSDASDVSFSEDSLDVCILVIKVDLSGITVDNCCVDSDSDFLVDGSFGD